MKILLLILLFSFSAMSDEIKLQFHKADGLVGEVLPATVSGYVGQPLDNKRVGDDFYIISLDADKAEVIFLKKITEGQIALDEKSLIKWTPIELKEVEVPQGVNLLEQHFHLPSSRLWIMALVVIMVLLALGIKYDFIRYRTDQALKKMRQTQKDLMFAATHFEEITEVWRKKHQLIEMFPGIEEAFLKFELEYYRVAFRPDIMDEDKKKVEKKYQDFLDLIRGVHFGI